MDLISYEYIFARLTKNGSFGVYFLTASLNRCHWIQWTINASHNFYHPNLCDYNNIRQLIIISLQPKLIPISNRYFYKTCYAASVIDALGRNARRWYWKELTAEVIMHVALCQSSCKNHVSAKHTLCVKIIRQWVAGCHCSWKSLQYAKSLTDWISYTTATMTCVISATFLVHSGRDY